MKERPILFRQPHADEMVRAILDGRKTQTRRLVKPQPPSEIEYPPEGRDGWFCSAVLGAKDYGHGLEWTVGASWGSQPCPKRWLHLLPKLAPPFGTVGDRLWVKETFGFSRQCDDVNEQERVVVYKACEPFYLTDAGFDRLKRCNSGCLMQPNHYVGAPSRWTPSIHMPRWASRIDLEITRVWVERVQDITEEDAKAEGIVESEIGRLASRVLKNYKMQTRAPVVLQFADLWQSIYGTWDANPFVWAYEFRRIKP